MNPLVIETLGLAAGTLTTIAFAPQVVRLYRTKSSEDISLTTYGVFCGGVVLWLVYGVLLASPAIIAANVATLTLALTVMVLAVRYR